MHRRKFLLLTGLGTALVAVPSLGLFATSTKAAAVDLILNELDYLKIDRQEVARFVDDFYSTFNKHDKLYTELQIKTLRLLKVKSNDSEMVDLLVRRFLPSTDFFINKMDERKPVKYLGLYNPYQSPCANPFSAIYYPAPVS